jgi:hypothetical protein
MSGITTSVIGVESPQPCRGYRLDADLLAQGRSQQIRHIGNHLVGIKGLRGQRLLAGESEKSLRKDSGPLARIARCIDEAFNTEITILYPSSYEVE